MLPRLRWVQWAMSAMLLSACTAPPPDAEQAKPEEQWPQCTNAAAGYSVSYPAGWKTNGGEVMPACSLFDPTDVAVQHGTEIPLDIAVVIVRDPVPFAEAVHGFSAVEARQQGTLDIDGHSAVYLEIVDDESGPWARLSLHYLVDLGGETLVASTYQEGMPDYAEKKAALQRMMNTLHFIPGS